MKTLFTTLLRLTNHYLLLTFSVLTLIGLTIFNQLEILVLGMITRSSTVYSETKSQKITNLLSYFEKNLYFNIDSFTQIIWIAIFVVLIKVFFLFFNKFFTKVLAVRICRDLRNECFDHLQKLPISFFYEYDRGKLSSRVITDVNQIALSFNSFVLNYIHMPFIVASTLSVCIYLSWKLSLVLMLGVPCMILPIQVITTRIRKISYRLQKKQESFASVIIDHLSGILTIKSYQLEKYSIKKYSSENCKMASYDEKICKYDMMTRPITHFLGMIMLVCILYIGLKLLNMSLPDLLVYCGILHMLYAPLKQFADENANVQKGVVAAGRINDILNHIQEGSVESNIFIDQLSSSISFNNVSFGYSSQAVLEQLTFSVVKGEVLAITGPTGSGKSTLLKLFLGFYDITSGDIFFDGINIKDSCLKSLRNQCSYVGQEPFLFNDTIRANLIFDRELSDEEIIKATKKAYIHDFIMTLDNGYDTLVQEMGKNFSGGQKQRLSLARALLRKSSVLLLDEATSSLDALSEEMIAKTLEEIKGDVTQVIIAHRLSSIQHADKVLFLNEGKIQSFGTLQEVIKQSPGFSAMWEASKLREVENV